MRAAASTASAAAREPETVRRGSSRPTRCHSSRRTASAGPDTVAARGRIVAGENPPAALGRGEGQRHRERRGPAEPDLAREEHGDDLVDAVEGEAGSSGPPHPATRRRRARAGPSRAPGGGTRRLLTAAGDRRSSRASRDRSHAVSRPARTPRHGTSRRAPHVRWGRRRSAPRRGPRRRRSAPSGGSRRGGGRGRSASSRGSRARARRGRRTRDGRRRRRPRARGGRGRSALRGPRRSLRHGRGPCLRDVGVDHAGAQR